MTAGPYLIDKSALVRLPRLPERAHWDAQISRGLVRIATVTLLEVGFSAQSATGHVDALDRPPVARMPVEYCTPAAERRCVEVQRILAARGQHRAPSVPDLLIAAIAEVAGLTILHVDKDFDLVAAVTGQPVASLG